MLALRLDTSSVVLLRHEPSQGGPAKLAVCNSLPHDQPGISPAPAKVCLRTAGCYSLHESCKQLSVALGDEKKPPEYIPDPLKLPLHDTVLQQSAK